MNRRWPKRRENAAPIFGNLLNRKEQENGRFFQDRYKANRLADEASLLASAA